MNRKRSNGSAALTPLPKSAVAARRASGVGGSPGQQRVAQAHPHAPRAERAAGRRASASPSRCAAKLDVVSTSSSAKRIGWPCSGPASPRSARRRGAPGCPAAPPARAARWRGRSSSRSPSPSGPSARPPAPARAARAHDSQATATAAPSGTGRRNSKPRRAMLQLRARLAGARRHSRSAPPARRRAARCGSHGPRACAVGQRAARPRRRKMLSAIGALSPAARSTKAASCPGRAAAARGRSTSAAGAARPAGAPRRGCAPGPA